MDLNGLAKRNGTGTGVESVKITFHTCRVHEKVTIGPSYGYQPVRVCNQAGTSRTLIGLCTISTNAVADRDKREHFPLVEI